MKKLAGAGLMQERMQLRRLCEEHCIDVENEARRSFGADLNQICFKKTRALTDRCLTKIIDRIVEAKVRPDFRRSQTRIDIRVAPSWFCS